MARRKLSNVPPSVRTKIGLMVADLIALWGITPGTDRERRQAYDRLRKKIEKAIKRWKLDPNEVYFMFGDVGNPATREETRERAMRYTEEHSAREWDPRK